MFSKCEYRPIFFEEIFVNNLIEGKVKKLSLDA